MSSLVELSIHYNPKTSEFELGGNIKEELSYEFIGDFLRTQIGAGEDNSPPNIRDSYDITIKCDLNEDVFSCSSNTGNKSLREGILMDILKSPKAQEAMASA